MHTFSGKFSCEHVDSQDSFWIETPQPLCWLTHRPCDAKRPVIVFLPYVGPTYKLKCISNATLLLIYKPS